jgi:tRNA1(Val) A37 N6-methylase TrmN6
LSELILGQLKSTKTFVDIGANAGYFSLLVKKNEPTIQVYSIEPFGLLMSLGSR